MTTRTRTVREVAPDATVAYVRGRTASGSRAHAVATDDPRWDAHAANTWGTALCGTLAKRGPTSGSGRASRRRAAGAPSP